VTPDPKPTTRSRRARSRFHTESIDCAPTAPKVVVETMRETEFEKRRGISRIEIREGYVQVHVAGLQEPLMPSRLAILQAIRDAEISLDFLKLTTNGLSFLVTADQSGAVQATLEGQAPELSVRQDRRVVMVHAVNMRDEEGLIARIVAAAIASGAQLEHVGDMHDRMLIVTDGPGATLVSQAIRSRLGVEA